MKACDEIIEGKLHDEFIVDPIQGRRGNIDQYECKRSDRKSGDRAAWRREKGDYSIVHPNDHVNCGQSTNDVIPTAGKITSLKLLKTQKRN